MEKLPIEFKEKWIAALRSGEYKQTKNVLKDDCGFCCLGVACVMAGMDNIAGMYIKDDAVPEIIRGNSANHNVKVLSEMNDEGKSFCEIADWIEENL